MVEPEIVVSPLLKNVNLVEYVSCCWIFIYHAGAEDPRCPILGLQEPASKTSKAYGEAGSSEKFMVTCNLLHFHCSFEVSH